MIQIPDAPWIQEAERTGLPYDEEEDDDNEDQMR